MSGYLPKMTIGALKVYVCGGGWVIVERELSDRLWLKPSLGQAEQLQLCSSD